MILGFSTQLNGKPTYFVERIWSGLLNKNFNLLSYHRFKNEAAIDGIIDQWDYKKNLLPKLHTIRDDKNNRWKAGNKIDFFINCRQKNMFRFAPVLPVVSIQKVEIIYFGEKQSVWINDRKLNVPRIKELAQNDGFDTIEDFFAYFDKDFTGKIIHWTDLMY